MRKIFPLLVIGLCCVAFYPRPAEALVISTPKPKFAYKDAETAKLTGSWQWLPTTQIGGVLELTSSVPGSANKLRFPITWMNKNTLRFCDANDHCDTLSRQSAATTSRPGS